MTWRRLGPVLVIVLAAVVTVGGEARPGAAEDGDLETAATVDLILSEAAAVRVTPEAAAMELGTLPAGGVATVAWSGRRQDAAGVIWVRVRAPLDGWMLGAAVGIASLSLGATGSVTYPTTPQLPLTGTGAVGPLPTPATIGGQ
jgi:hypothetical protein